MQGVIRAVAVPLWLCAAAAAAPQWVPFEQLPQAEEVRQIEQQARGISSAGKVNDVRWDPASGTLWFEYAGSWRTVPMAGGTPAAAQKDAPAAPEDPSRSGYREPRGARGTQAAEVPSPDGKWRAVFKNANVTLVPTAEGEQPVQVTTEGKDKLKFGSADWVYAEELDQNTAMWWSPDSKRLAYYAFDERPVKDYCLVSGLTQTRTQPLVAGYPKPGDENGVAKLEIYELATKRRVPVDVGPDAAQYVYGARWTPKGDALLFFRTNRRQDTLELCAANPATGEVRTLIKETSDTWHDNSPALRFLSDGSRFLWQTESNGFPNWQLWDLAKGKLADLTKDAWVAGDIVEVDEAGGWLYYVARSSETKINPQLHRVKLDGTGGQRLTQGDMHWSGFHIAPDGSCFVATKEFVDTPPMTGLYGMDGALRATLAQAPADALAKRGVTPPEFLRLKAEDGTELYGILYKPRGYDPEKKYPLVLSVYGGPGVNTVSTRFQPVEGETEFGLLMAKLDNRGTPGRGKAFESATYLNLGGKDVDDQALLVKELVKRGLVDPKRVAVTGHSYGGYMTLMCMLRYPELFSVGVAGAPPSDWRQYDTIYTERYMRTPQENSEGYDRGSAVRLAKKLKGRILLLHGMVDDNVHPANTFAIADQWQRGNTPFEMMLFPTSNHGIFSPAHESVKWSFLLRNLGLWSPDQG